MSSPPPQQKMNRFPIHFELRPNRDLLDMSFQGYKLSLEKLPLYSLPLEISVDHTRPSEYQYSIQHFKLQVFTNHILADPWNPDVVYFVDQEWNVNRSAISKESRKLLETKKVWSIPVPANKESSRFNVTVSFPTKTHMVVADGCGNFYLILTGDRANSRGDWKVLLRESPFPASTNPQFIILDSRVYQKENDDGWDFMDLLFLRIDPRPTWKESLELHQDKYSYSKMEHPFVSVLEWLTLSSKTADTDVWTRKSLRTYVGHSSVDYACLESNGEGIFVASNDPFHCCFDSEQEIRIHEKVVEKRKSEFIWSQSEDTTVKIWLRLPVDVSSSDLKIETQPKNLSISYKERVVLSGDLCNPVKAEETKWTLDGGRLEISLVKSDGACKWEALISGNETGEEILDTGKIDLAHARLAHMCSDKWGGNPHDPNVIDTREIEEECDEFPADSALLMRIDKDLQRITHQSSLGSHQWLFNTRTEPESSVSICLRHDVDGILWLPKTMTRTPVLKRDGGGDCTPDKLDWTCEHVTTFSALGYVQASKELRKFTICPKDFSYVAICDSVKHVHVYRKPGELENDLRNRKTGQIVTHVSKQHVISIDSGAEILGAYAAADFMLILTSNNIIQVQMMGTSEIL